MTSLPMPYTITGSRHIRGDVARNNQRERRSLISRATQVWSRIYSKEVQRWL
jgi:hypothetical protein